MLVAKMPSASSQTLRSRESLRRASRCRPAVVSRRSASSVAFEPLAFLGRQPLRVARTVGEKERQRDAQQHRRGTFDQEDPLPACEVEPVLFEQRRGNVRPSVRLSGTPMSITDIARARSLPREPVREVDDHPGKESGLGQTEQETREVELPRRPDQSHCHRDRRPR